MSQKLPQSVAHLFDVKRIGKIYRAFCKRCRYEVNFLTYPVTPLTHARMARHVDHHEDLGDFVCQNPEQLKPICEDPPQT